MQNKIEKLERPCEQCSHFEKEHDSGAHCCVVTFSWPKFSIRTCSCNIYTPMSNLNYLEHLNETK